MKKIICLLLVLISLFACTSCALVDKIFGKKGSVETVRGIVDDSQPTKIVTRTEYVGKDTLTGLYTTKIDRASGVSQFDFEYQRYAEVEDLLPESIKTVHGSVVYHADGSVTDANGDTWSAEDALGYIFESINLDPAGFKSYELLDNGNDLKAYVPAGESVRIFGTSVEAKGDILLEIDTNGKYLYNVKITYTATDDATVVVNTSYDYAHVSVG